MLRAAILCASALAFLPAAEELIKPANVPLNTWVREDLFAGWMANDADTFEHGVRKLNVYLQDHPDDPSALAWKNLVVAYRMRQALAAGDDAAYRRLLSTAKELRQKTFASYPQDPAYRDGRELLNKVPGLQKDYFEHLPPHMRGELWSQIAFASDRLGDTAERDRVIAEMLAKLQGSPYETRARHWQKLATLKNEGDYTCLSCHEPGRLASVMAKK